MQLSPVLHANYFPLLTGISPLVYIFTQKIFSLESVVCLSHDSAGEWGDYYLYSHFVFLSAVCMFVTVFCLFVCFRNAMHASVIGVV